MAADMSSVHRALVASCLSTIIVHVHNIQCVYNYIHVTHCLTAKALTTVYWIDASK